MVCKICSNEVNNKIHVAREMLFGSGDRFEYVECAHCGCLQIVEPPQDLSKHYPPNYDQFHRPAHRHDTPIYKWVRKKRAEYGLTGRGVMGRLIALIRPLPPYYERFRKCRIGLDSRILDMGCGGAKWLVTLHRDGFRNLLGVDPYVPDEMLGDKEGFTILRGTADDLGGQGPFDFIAMHHSFEHMPDPLHVLQALHARLNENGSLWINLPVVGYAWRHYGVNWVGLEAPRHLFIHTTKSMKILADQSGFKMADISYDSTEYQFWASEQYVRGISLWDKNSYMVDQMNSIFTQEQIESFRSKASELNQIADGDQASFTLCKR